MTTELFDGKVVIVTGATKGIGRAITMSFLSKNATVIPVARNQDELDSMSEFLSNEGYRIHPIRADVSNYEEVSDMANIVNHKFGHVDILVNNAGIIDDSLIEKMTINQWHKVLNVNLNGTFYCIKAVLPYMINNGYGRIINITSISGERGSFGQANYSASKAAVIGLTKSLALELGQKGILINAIAPGLVMTDIVRNIPDKIKEKNLSRIPLGRYASVEEIAETCIFLASDSASYFNGSVIDVNGGIY